jgi:hypothetical protein
LSDISYFPFLVVQRRPASTHKPGGEAYYLVLQVPFAIDNVSHFPMIYPPLIFLEMSVNRGKHDLFIIDRRNLCFGDRWALILDS